MGTRLYVGNLPSSADETQIRDLFSQNGARGVRGQARDRSQNGSSAGLRLRGDGSGEAADGAIRELNGKDFGGRALTVNDAKERSSGGFGGRGGGGNRYYYGEQFIGDTHHPAA